MRPTWSNALAWWTRNGVCPRCHIIISNDVQLEAHWRQGHLDDIPAADCHTPMSQPAPVYTGVHMPDELLRLLLLVAALIGGGIGAGLGIFIIRLLK